MKNFNQHLFYLLFLMPVWAMAQTGIVKGRVTDSKNNEPIPFANVALVGTTLGTTTDDAGYYEITNVEPRLYTITASYLGYKSKTEAEIQVTNSKPAIVDFALTEESEQLSTVEVVSSPFNKTEESPVSLRTIGATEIQRNPGGNRDVSRVVRVLPGVTTTAANRNDLLIRGGAPSENRFYLDDVEVPNINHFATQGASGGPNGMLNVDFIREVDFFSGAFPANRGNTLSSVFNFKQKNGRDDRVGFTLTSGTSEAALSVEGPLGKSKKTTFLASARQSYLQLLFKALDLPILPTYNDFQFKVRTRLDEKNEFYVVGLGALDRFRLNLDATETPSQRYLLNSLPIYYQWNYTLGAVYRRSTQTGYWTFVLSRNMLNNDIYKHIDNDESKPRFIDYSSQESENKLRIENTSRFKTWKLNYGVSIDHVRYYNRTQDYETRNGVVTPVQFESNLYFAKYGVFGQLSNKFWNERVVVSAGLRADGTSYSDKMANPLQQLSPRLSVAYAFAKNFALNVNTGIYYQLPSYTAMGYRQNGALANQNRLTYIRSSHVVGGIEYTTKSNTKISVEGYYKYYSNYPFLLNEQISLANVGNNFGVIGNTPIESRGNGRSYGIEVLIQQRLYKGFYGILAYTLGKTEFQDKNGNYVPSSWDARHIINLAAGKNWNTMNSEIRERINSRRIAKGKEAITRKLVNQTLDLGLNIRLQTGLPYTPYDVAASALRQNWDRRGTGILDYTRLNSMRANTVYGVDFRIDYKWFFPAWSFNLYLDMQNIPGVANGNPTLILDQGENGDQPVQIVNQGQANESYVLKQIPASLGTTIPTIGIIIQY